MQDNWTRRDFVSLLAALSLLCAAPQLLVSCMRSNTKAVKAGDQIPRTRVASKTITTESRVDLGVAMGGTPSQNTTRAIEQIGGIGRFVSKGDKVIIKPNILHASPPEYAATTSPEVIGTIVALCKAAGASDILVIDRPTSGVEEAYEVSGIGPATESAGGRVKILRERDFIDVEIPKGLVLKSWPVARDVLDADVLINVPIGKVHGVTGLTLGIKNLMGILGSNRGQIHIDIHQKLADLASLIKPTLTVLDANRILIRNGPGGGNLEDVKETKTVVAGTDHVLVDAFATTIFNMQPTDIQYIANAADMGLGSIDIANAVIKSVAI